MYKSLRRSVLLEFSELCELAMERLRRLTKARARTHHAELCLLALGRLSRQALPSTLSLEYAQPAHQCRFPVRNPYNLFSLPPTTSKSARRTSLKTACLQDKPPGILWEASRPPLNVEFTVTLKSSCPASFRDPRFMDSRPASTVRLEGHSFERSKQ